MVIEATIGEAGEGGHAYVFVSSVVGKGPELERSPLTAEQKIPLLEAMFKGRPVTFVNTATCDPRCAGPSAALVYLLKTKGYAPEDVAFVIGKERLDFKKNPTEYFGPEAPLWGKKDNPRPGRFVPVGDTAKRNKKAPPDDAANMSGTKARGYLAKGDFESFYTAIGVTDEDLKNPKFNDVVVSVIKSIQASQGTKGGGDNESEDISVYGPDGEDPELRGGRRRKTRRQRPRRATRRNRASDRA